MRRIAILTTLVLLAGACGDDSAAIDAGPGEPATTTTGAAITTTAAPLSPALLAISLCNEIDVAVPEVIGTVAGGTNLPDAVTAAARQYADDHLDTFAQIWIDRDYGGTLVLAFTDDPAEHRANLPAALVDSGFAFDVVQVAFTAAELDGLQAEAGQALFGRDDMQVVGMGAGNKVNRVTLDMVRPTADQLVTIAGEYPDRAEMFCLEGGLWDESQAPPSVDEPFTVMADAGDDPLVTCSGSGPFHLSVLEGDPDVAADSTDEAERALLDGALMDDGGGTVPQQGWRTLSRDDEHATFYWFENESFLIHDLENTPGGWTLRGSSSGSDEDGCRLRLHVGEGVGLMNIGFDPAHPVDATSTMLHLLVSQVACSGGASGIENMRPPEVIETETEIRLAIAVVPPEGSQTCPGNEAAPIVIELDAPIGDRQILDGIQIPAEPLGDLDF